MRGLKDTKLPVCKPCHCGCGLMLYPYDNRRPMVCHKVWALVAEADKRAIRLPGASLEEKRAAARRVLELARAIEGLRRVGRTA